MRDISDLPSPDDDVVGWPENPTDFVHARTHEARHANDPTEDTESPDEVLEFDEAARELFAAPDVLARLRDDLAARPFAGETRNVELLYLAITSRLLDRIVSMALKGASAAGKNATVDQALRYFPSSAYFARTQFSPKALYYSEEAFEHRMLVLFEGHPLAGGDLAATVRTLLSEGRLVYEVADWETRGSRVLETRGPAGLVTATTLDRLDPELETRLLSAPVPDTAEQTRAVLLAIAEREAGAGRGLAGYKPWLAMQQHLASLDNRVRVPFAHDLAMLVDAQAVRMRRDFNTILSLVKAHAILHQQHRERDADGTLRATIEQDYGQAFRLAGDLFAEAVEQTVGPHTRETVAAIQRLRRSGRVTAGALARDLGIEVSTGRRRAYNAIEQGYIVNHARRNTPMQLDLGDPLPEDATVLPTPEELGDACKRARTTGEATT